MLKLSVLFSIDAFGGGFIPQSLMAYWFHIQFGADPGQLGLIFFAANLLAAVSSLSAARIARRFGLINTMVFTHIPSNVLLILVPLMPTLPLAVLVLLIRFSLSQMDVPTRQSYVMAVVDPDERSAAAGRDRRRPDDRRGDLAVVLVGADGQRRLRVPAVLPRGQPQDPVRPADVPRVPERQAAGGAPGQADAPRSQSSPARSAAAAAS